MRSAVVALAALALAVGVAGCGSEGTSRALPATVQGTLPKASQEPAAPAFKLKGNPEAGQPIFAKAGCKSCHTLAAAHASGTVGPNLDQVKPSYDKVVHQVEVGGGAMPPFKGTLTPKQIQDVAAFVFTSTHA
jgi:mono/diheme cytochrome c family protein